MFMCVGVKNRIVTCEKYIFWCEKGYKWILALGSAKTYYYCVEEIYDYQVDPEYVTDKLIDLEDRSRRNNLRINDILESRNKTWEEYEEEIQKVFNEKLDIKNVQIERAHRSKRSESNSNNEKPRTMVCKLLNYKQKEEILRNTKKT